jgi:ubiquinone/menaquinone biosynthesis C-methylase UbiE
VLSFASPADLGARMIAAGFADVEWKRMTAGVVCLWCGRRPRVS